ncbi:Recombinase [Acetatifactor muris]|uniref:Recombinase n=1 Tax=Acetatifactor muris TaxID=879566 RepID=A0A2K4ZD91_9FIRM|nr:Recombinase [Acetatifactor muris]
MMEAVKRGEVGCIIVKDFSRLGRDYIEVGSYLEQIFPLMEVRCISVNDHYDSEGVLGTAGGLNVAFKNLINMLYSRDLSKKIRSAQMARARKGEYLGGFARYGYEKSQEDKHRLVVDPEAAEVVRKIFTMAAEGVTISGIVRYLNDNGVLTCVEYKQRKNSRYQHPGGGVKKLWGTQSVRSILSDETYIGKVVWNRSEKSITTGKRMLWHDRSEWVVVDGQHEPMVSEELFALANERAKPKKRDRSGVDMSGFKREVLFVCGYCGRSMVKKNHKYCCRYRTCGTDTECRRAVEDMEKLEGSVMEYVRKTAEVMLGNSGRKDVGAERETLGKKVDALRKEKERLSAEKMFLYDKYRSGV